MSEAQLHQFLTEREGEVRTFLQSARINAVAHIAISLYDLGHLSGDYVRYVLQNYDLGG